MTIRGAGTVVIAGVSPQEVFDFVLDPAKHRKADTDAARHTGVRLVHGLPESVHAWFDITETERGARLEHVEEMTMSHGLIGGVDDRIARRCFASAVEQEAVEIARLIRAGERGRGISTQGDTANGGSDE